MGLLRVIAASLALCSTISQAAVLSRDGGVGGTDFDVVIVGGGPAGLSALSGLSRVRRTALMLDSQEYRNGETRHMHDVIGNDGTAPEQFRGLARQQISKYPTAQIKFRKATNIESKDNGSHPYFITTDDSGQNYTSRKIVLATGLRDILPETPGVKEAWSRGIFWCPWCDGWEHRDQPFGILGSIVKVLSAVLEVDILNKDIIAFVNGTDTAENRKILDATQPGWKEMLDAYGVKVINETITEIKRLQDGAIVQDVSEGKEFDKFSVILANGLQVDRSAFITNFPSVQRSKIGELLGVKYYGEKMNVDPRSMRTDVPGVFAVGDANSDNSTNVPHAMYSGKRAAVNLHVEIETEHAATLVKSAGVANSVTKREEDEILDLMGRDMEDLWAKLELDK